MSEKKLSDVHNNVWEGKGHYYLRLSLEGTLENQRIFKMLQTYLEEKSKVMNFFEVGCACGATYNYLEKKFGRGMEDSYFGMDISKNSIDFCHLLYPKAWFKQGDIRTFKFKQKHQIIFSSEVLVHLAKEFIKPIIKRFIDYSSEMCLFSVRFTDLEDLEFRYIDKGCEVFYTYLNLPKLISFIEKNIPEKATYEIDKVYGSKWFCKTDKYNLKHYNKRVGNLNILIKKR